MFDILPSTQTHMTLKDKKQPWTICFHYVIQISGHIIISNSVLNVTEFQSHFISTQEVFPSILTQTKKGKLLFANI